MDTRSSKHVNIVIPTYSRVHLLKSCLESALAQQYEILVVTVLDNASEDSTQDLMINFVIRESVALDTTVTSECFGIGTQYQQTHILVIASYRMTICSSLQF